MAACGADVPGLWERELAFSERLLRDDVRNNSAWNQRHFVLAAAPAGQLAGAPRELYDRWAGGRVLGGCMCAAGCRFAGSQGVWHSSSREWGCEGVRRMRWRVAAWLWRAQSLWRLAHAPTADPAAPSGPAARPHREVEFAASKLRLAPHNESAWAYLRGLALLAGAPRRAAGADGRWRAAAEEALRAAPSCAPALALLAEVYAEQGVLLEEEAVAAAAGAEGGSGTCADLLRAAEVARRLAAEVLRKLAVADPLREGFYAYHVQQLAGRQGEKGGEVEAAAA